MNCSIVWRIINSNVNFLPIAVIVILTCIVISCNTSKQTKKTEEKEKQRNEVKKWDGDIKEAELQDKAKENLASDNSQDEKIEDANRARSVILGKWKWEKTICCGRRPEVMKPKDKKKDQFLVFKADSTVLFYKGNEIEKRKTYQIKQGTLVNNVPEMKIEGQRTAILRLSRNQLVLDYSYIDLQTEYYNKAE